MIKFLTLKNQTPVFASSFLRKSGLKSENKFNLNGANLAPLKEDTVSFEGRKKTQKPQTVQPQTIVKTRASSEKKLEDKTWTISHGLAHSIYRKAEHNTSIMKSTLDKYLKTLFPEPHQEYTLERPVAKLEFRTKKANSIREKATQKFLYTKEGVIHMITDLSGARVILGDGSRESGNIVIDKIMEAVKDGRLKVIEAENHIPTDKKYQYASQTKLRLLAQASSEKYGIFVPDKIVRNNTGYTAIHLLVEFQEGFRGEIQILGHDVAMLKDVEDIPYKILQGKSVDKKYADIKKAFEPLLPVDNNPDNPDNVQRIKLKREFMDYTQAAYRYEREKATRARHEEEQMLPEFRTLGQFEKKYRKKVHLPKELDFNNLYKLKSRADWEKTKNS